MAVQGYGLLRGLYRCYNAHLRRSASLAASTMAQAQWHEISGTYLG